MTFQHAEQAAGKWNQRSLVEQMANIGSEIFRTISWRDKGNSEYSQAAFYRALELFDLTKADPKNIHRLKEVCRARELAVDYFFGDNVYHSDDDFWQRYFYYFNYAARIGRGV